MIRLYFIVAQQKKKLKNEKRRRKRQWWLLLLLTSYATYECPIIIYVVDYPLFQSVEAIHSNWCLYKGRIA